MLFSQGELSASPESSAGRYGARKKLGDLARFV